MEQAIIVLVVVGFLMVAAEVFVPGMVLGTLGGICLLVSVVLCYMAYGPIVGTLVFAVMGVFLLAGFFVWLRMFPRTVIGKQLTLGRTLRPNSSVPETFSVAPGATGVAVTPLRPAGTALIGGRKVDVVAENLLIDSGQEVVVVAVEGFRTVVRRKN